MYAVWCVCVVCVVCVCCVRSVCVVCACIALVCTGQPPSDVSWEGMKGGGVVNPRCITYTTLIVFVVFDYSISGHRAVGSFNLFYAASKFAVTALTEGLRKELREIKSNIKITVSKRKLCCIVLLIQVGNISRCGSHRNCATSKEI